MDKNELGYFGKKYQTETTTINLLLLFGEACLCSAYCLLKVFNLPKRGSIILRIIKFISFKSYKSYNFQHNHTYTHCLFLVISKLYKDIQSKLGSATDEIANLAIIAIATQISKHLSYSSIEDDWLLCELDKRYHEYSGLQNIDETDVLKKILDGLKIKGIDRRIADFFLEVNSDNSKNLVETDSFCDKYLELQLKNHTSCKLVPNLKDKSLRNLFIYFKYSCHRP